VRVVGYVRESPVLGDTETAYAQKEHIRRWCRDSGHVLISVCQDVRVPGTQANRDGYRALLEIVRGGHAEAVIVSDLAALSPDKVLQEVMIEDLRASGATFISAEPADLDALSGLPADRARMVIRDIVARVRSYLAEYPEPVVDGVIDLRDGHGEVIVELIPARSGQEDSSAAQAARPTA